MNKEIQIGPRDRRLLRLCYEHGFLAREHVDTLFPSRHRANARLRLFLVSGGLLYPTASPLDPALPIFRLTPRGRYRAEADYPFRIEIRRQLSPALLPTPPWSCSFVFAWKSFGADSGRLKAYSAGHERDSGRNFYLPERQRNLCGARKFYQI